MRHLKISTDGIAAVDILENLLSQNGRPVRHIFADNFSGLLPDEWISNELKVFARSMSSGETVVFIVDHPCFNGLYDALISFDADFFAIEVNKSFRIVIIIDYDPYLSLPPPFLNRFEKIPIDFSLVLTEPNWRLSLDLKNYVCLHFQHSMSDLFRCYNGRHFHHQAEAPAGVVPGRAGQHAEGQHQ
jgi:hypothetical protein